VQRAALRHTENVAVSTHDDVEMTGTPKARVEPVTSWHAPVQNVELNDREGFPSVDFHIVLNKYFVGLDNAQKRLWWKLWIFWVRRLPVKFARIAITRMRLHIWHMICRWLGTKRAAAGGSFAVDADGLCGARGLLDFLDWSDAQERNVQMSTTVKRLVASGSLRGGAKGRGNAGLDGFINESTRKTQSGTFTIWSRSWLRRDSAARCIV
jgi:hypothetical protein